MWIRLLKNGLYSRVNTYIVFKTVMFTIGMLLSCVFITNTGLEKQDIGPSLVNSSPQEFTDFDKYAVTCYICVNVSNNLICNQFAIDRPCKPGEIFCHTLHIMDSKGTSVLVNKKCTTEKECRRNKVGCVDIDAQKMCISCCDQDYCNVNVPTNSSTAIFDDKITKMRMLAKNLFREQEKALTTSVKQQSSASILTYNNRLRLLIWLMIVVILY